MVMGTSLGGGGEGDGYGCHSWGREEGDGQACCPRPSSMGS